MAFCAFLNERERLDQAIDLDSWDIDFGADGYRLPTEAEWEYAARGGVAGTHFPWGDELDSTLANFLRSGPPSGPYYKDVKAPVGSYPPNGFGLYDVIGNVREWCADWYDADYYSISPTNDPRGPDTGSHRTYRGGDYAAHGTHLRCARRQTPGTGTGLRPARSVAPTSNQ